MKTSSWENPSSVVAAGITIEMVAETEPEVVKFVGDIVGKLDGAPLSPWDTSDVGPAVEIDTAGANEGTLQAAIRAASAENAHAVNTKRNRSAMIKDAVGDFP